MIFDAAGGGVRADPRGDELMIWQHGGAMLRGWMLRGWVRSGGPQRTPAPVHGVVHVTRPG